MYDPWLLLPLLLVTLFAGWLLGRSSGKKLAPAPSHSLNKAYFAGLDYLLNEKPDEAIDSFIRALEVNSDTLPAHLALAKLLRKKGDVQRAIHIHQALLARPELSREESLRIQMALAADYDAVGLLDRAENLLKDILKQQPPVSTRRRAQTLLIKLYEKEKEWQQALDLANSLDTDQQQILGPELAHYQCEIAENSLLRGEYRQAAIQLKQALEWDAKCVRVSLLQAEAAMQQQQWKAAIKALQQVEGQDILLVPETLDTLQHCYEQVSGSGEYGLYLKHLMLVAPSTSVMLALAENMVAQRGEYAAAAFITDELKHRPSVKGFNRLMDMYIAQSSGMDGAEESLNVLRSLTGTLENSKPRYQCNRCGYTSRAMVWQCPSCKHWGSSKPIRGLEGE